MNHLHKLKHLHKLLAAFVYSCSLLAAEPSTDPLWDGHESVAAYAQRAHLDAEKTVDLGNGVKLEFVLIPAGQFLMGAPEPIKPALTVFSGQVLIGMGAAMVLVLTAYLLLRKQSGQRFSFSLRWLMAFSLACSIVVWGGTRWQLALTQIREYDVAMARFHESPSNEKPVHLVRIAKAFYMGKYPVTQAQYIALTGTNPSSFKGPQHPVECVSWHDAVACCMQLNKRLGTQALEARLPTEAEWEYACRAGTTTRFYSGDADSDLAAAAWFPGNSGGKTHPVGGKNANAFGLFDMHGNVWQWCQDKYRDGSEKLNGADALNRDPGAERALRGGSWETIAVGCRTTCRGHNFPDLRDNGVGFRIALTMPLSKPLH